MWVRFRPDRLIYPDLGLLDHLSVNHDRTLHHSRHHRCCNKTCVSFSRILTSSPSRSSSDLSENRHPTFFFFWLRNTTMFILSRSQETTMDQHWEAKSAEKAASEPPPPPPQQQQQQPNRCAERKEEFAFQKLKKMQNNIVSAEN